MRENLFLRTDTLPEEIPLLFTNSNLYKNFSRKKITEINSIETQKKPILKSFHTVPYVFYIPKNNLENRKMSLLHPIAQLQIFQYILKYDQLISSFCLKSKYSVRSPILRNQPVFIPSKAVLDEITKIEQEFSFHKNTSITSDETEAYFYNYFSYKSYKKITELHNSNKFRRDLYKYNFYKKFDIQNFFGSIYTHSLAWAIFGEKSVAKKYKSREFDDIFSNATDKICQLINFNETNGIVIGPEFSRVISEVLLTRIDISVYQALEKEKLTLEKDYKIYRFMDDFFIFFNEENTIKIIEENLSKNLEIYNLKLNVNKTELQKRPFYLNDSGITKLITLIDNFKIHILASSNFKVYKKNSKSILYKLQQNIELIILEHPNSTSKILNYFLKFIRSVLSLEMHQYTTAQILEIITNIYSLNINYHSTHNLIATYAVLSQKINALTNDERALIADKATYLEERFFQHLFIILRNNKDKLSQMYDIFVYLKTLPKKISSDFLCEFIDQYSNNYFIICSIAYYILDDSLQGINPIYKTVEKKIKSIFINFNDSYSPSGADSKFLEGEYFFFLNDFSYYPGFDQTLRQKLRKELIEASNYNANGNNLSPKANSINFIIEKVTSGSYYDWNKSPEHFIKEIAKKSSNLLNRRPKYD